MAFSPDGTTLASGSGSGVRLWNAENGQLKAPLQGESYVSSVAFSPDGTTLASGSGSGVHLWDTTSGQIKNTLQGHTDGVSSVAFSPDGTILASGSRDGTILLWDMQIFQLQPALLHEGVEDS